MEFHRQIKKNARASLRGSWGKAVAIFFTIMGVFLLISALEQILYLVLGLTGFQDVLATPDFYLDDQLSLDLGAVACTGLSSLLLFLLGAPLTAGAAGWYFSLSAGTSLGFEGLFWYFTSGKRYVRALGTTFLLGLRSALWAAAFLLPPACLSGVFTWASSLDNIPALAMVIDLGLGASWVLFAVALLFLVIFLQRYFLVYYLLADRPETPVPRLLKLSVRMMSGHKWEAFSLRFSFLGWALLSLLIFPLMYTYPFFQASMAIYARYAVECYQRAQMGKVGEQDADFEPTFEPYEPFVPPEPAPEAAPSGDDGKTREYAFSDLQERMEGEQGGAKL